MLRYAKPGMLYAFILVEAGKFIRRLFK